MSGLHIEGTYQTGQGHTLMKMLLCQMLFQASDLKGWQSSKPKNPILLILDTFANDYGRVWGVLLLNPIFMV